MPWEESKVSALTRRLLLLLLLPTHLVPLPPPHLAHIRTVARAGIFFFFLHLLVCRGGFFLCFFGAAPFLLPAILAGVPRCDWLRLREALGLGNPRPSET